MTVDKFRAIYTLKITRVSWSWCIGEIENYGHIFSHKKSNENPVHIDDFPGAAGVALTILTIGLTTVTVVYVVLCRLAASSRCHEKVSYYEMLTLENRRRFVVTNAEMCQKLQGTIPSKQRKDQRMGVQILLTFKPTHPPSPETKKTSRTKCCGLRRRYESPQATVSIREVDNGDVSLSAASYSKPQTEQSLDATVPGFEQDLHNDNRDEIQLIYHSRLCSLQPDAVLKSLPICWDSDLHDSNNIGRKEHESNNTKANMSLEIFEDPNNSFSCKGKKITSAKSDNPVCGNNRTENEESFLTTKVAAQTRALEDNKILTLTEIDNENLVSQFTMYDHKNNSITPDTDVPDKKLEITKSKNIIEMSVNDDISRLGKANSEIPFRNVKQELVEAGGFVGSSLEDISRKIREINHRRGIKSCSADHQKELGQSSSSDNRFLSLKKLDIPLAEGTQNRADDGKISKKGRLNLEELHSYKWKTIRKNRSQCNRLVSNSDLPVIGSLVYCEGSALDRAANEARLMFLVLTPLGETNLRLESRLKAMENRLRLEELRNRSYISRVTQAETNLLKLSNQLDILDSFVSVLMKQQQQQPEVNLAIQQGLCSLNAASISTCVPDTHFPVFVPSGPPTQFPLVVPKNIHAMIQNIREEIVMAGEDMKDRSASSNKEDDVTKPTK
uniref:Uncharacterized protein n=1 Tax=Timema bartmani TaxID=61472 RepID=A0A7R9EXF1_9NEOP|nr:unnamed protein product [Timema bartmani]